MCICWYNNKHEKYEIFKRIRTGLYTNSYTETKCHNKYLNVTYNVCETENNIYNKQ